MRYNRFSSVVPRGSASADVLPQNERRIWLKTLIGSLLPVALSIAALSLSLYTITTTFSGTPRVNPAPELISLGTCGRSWQEAESLGCVFDIMMSAWVRPECYDKELSDAFFYAHSTPWTFTSDYRRTKSLPYEELLKGRYELDFVEGGFHFTHCAYTWARQMKQIGKRPMVLDSKARDWHHSIHCAGMIAETNTTYINGIGHANLGTSIDCIVGDWTPFESIPEELQNRISGHE